MKKRKVGFLILHYNATDVTKKCVESILKLNQSNECEVVIVDNASPNGSGKELQNYYEEKEQIHVLLNKSNAGFSAGNNFGYYYIKENFDLDYLVVTNNDIEFVDKDFICKVEQEYRKSNFYVLGPDIWNVCTKVHQNPLDTHIHTLSEVNKTIKWNSVFLRFFFLGYPLVKIYEKIFSSKVVNNHCQERQEEACLMGACLIFSKDFINENEKVFEPETFFYYEEYILMHKCRNLGKKVVFLPDILVHHLEGASTNSYSKDDKKKRRFMMKNILESAKIYREYIKNDY